MSNNSHNVTDNAGSRPSIASDQLGAFGFTMRIGVADGLHLLLRTGLGIDHAVTFGFFEAHAQFPVQPDWALRVMASYSEAGNIEARGGIRYWLTGRGGAGSLAITVEGGLGYLAYRTPERSRGYPAGIELLGPGAGIGFEARL